MLQFGKHIPALQESVVDAQDFLRKFVAVWSAQVFHCRDVLPKGALELYNAKGTFYHSYIIPWGTLILI